MGLAAPNFDDLSKKQQQITIAEGESMSEEQSTIVNNIHDDIAYGFAKTCIIGAGGAGKVAAIRFSKIADPEVARFITIDTSGVPAELPNVESIKISDLNGSGKLRRGNVEAISNFISDFTNKTQFELVNIIINSYSGGSGSVIAPLLVDEILRQGKIAIVIGIIDTDSEIDTTNAFNCLRTYDNITNNRKAYLPMILFNNSFGRPTVDNGIITILKHLIEILNIPYIGLDVQDRIKFLNPNSFDGVAGGVKLLNVSKRDDGEWEEGLGLVITPDKNEKLDALMIIDHVNSHSPITRKFTVIFRGYFTEDKPRIVASVGYQLPKDLVKLLNDNVHAFRTINTAPKTDIVSEYDIGETTNGGLVL